MGAPAVAAWWCWDTAPRRRRRRWRLRFVPQVLNNLLQLYSGQRPHLQCYLRPLAAFKAVSRLANLVTGRGGGGWTTAEAPEVRGSGWTTATDLRILLQGCQKSGGFSLQLQRTACGLWSSIKLFVTVDTFNTTNCSGRTYSATCGLWPPIKLFVRVIWWQSDQSGNPVLITDDSSTLSNQ